LRFGGAVRFRILVGQTGRLQTVFDSLTSHFCERLDWVMPLDGNRLLTRLLTLWLSFGLGVFSRCQPPASGVKYHSLGPFMIRTDPDVYRLVQRDVGRPRTGNRHGRAPARGEQRRDKKASHPPDIPQQRHGHRLSADLPTAVRGGRPR